MRDVRRLQPTVALEAIYIDFEGLGTANAKPALLGALCCDAEGDWLCQYVLDDRLTRATVASRSCARMDIDDAVAAIVDRAEREGRFVVSWSTFDLSAVARWCDPALTVRFGAVYRNALESARPWKRAVYRTFKFELDPFGGKHPLKEYFRMVGYELPRHLLPTTPAKWLKHVLEQMEKNSGRYRQTTPETKRDWHRLLDYNKHDCRGMRRVCVQAARELALWDAYGAARYVVHDGHRDVNTYPKSRSPKLDALLTRTGADRWAILTAWNPESLRLSRRENDARQRQLLDVLHSAGYETLAAEGRDPAGAWPPEPSLFVPGITKKQARALGRQFGQLAVLVGHRGSAARLVASGLPPDRPQPDTFA